MYDRNPIRWVLNPWVIGGALFFALLLLAATILLLLLTRPEPSPAAPATAVLNVIPAPTATQPPPTPTPTPLESPTPTLPVPPPPGPGVIEIGTYVQISGTGGDGLRLRTDPGLQSEVRMLGAEAEVFQVKDGPGEIDGFTWWYIVGPFDESRRGWAVANYLTVVQEP